MNTDPTIPTNPTDPSGSDKGSRIKKTDKIAIMNVISSSFTSLFPQLDSEEISGLVRYFGDHMCRKLAKTPLYQSSGTVTVQGLRDAFGAVLVDRVLHKESILKDSIPTSPASAAIVVGVTAPFGSPAVAQSIPTNPTNPTDPSGNPVGSPETTPCGCENGAQLPTEEPTNA